MGRKIYLPIIRKEVPMDGNKKFNIERYKNEARMEQIIIDFNNNNNINDGIKVEIRNVNPKDDGIQNENINSYRITTSHQRCIFM